MSIVLYAIPMIAQIAPLKSLVIAGWIIVIL
jgi:hypothetical protein